MTPQDLKAWRHRLGLRQDQAADLLDVSLPTYQRYEYGSLFSNKVQRAVAAAAYGASQALREVMPIVDRARFKRDPFDGVKRMANGFLGRARYPDVSVALYLAKLRLAHRPIYAGKHKLTGMSIWIDERYEPPEPPNLLRELTNLGSSRR